MKAQSAVEYLVTYGWMVVAVGVAGGVAYSGVSSECVESASGFTGTDIVVEDFGPLSSSELGMVLYNSKSEEIEFERIQVSNSTYSVNYPFSNKSLDPGTSEGFEIPGVVNSDQCNSLDIEIVYDIGSISGQKSSGEITSNFEMQALPPPEQPANLSAEYTGP